MPRANETEIQAAMQLHSAGQLDRAERAYRQILTQNPQDPATTHMLGMLLHQRGNNDAAEPLLLRSLELAGHIADFEHNYALVCRNLGKLDVAAAHLRRALLLSGGSAATHDLLGLVLEDQGNFTEAANSFVAAVAANPDFADAHLHLGMLHMRQGRHRESIEMFQRAVRIQPGLAAAHIALCSTLGKLERFDESIHHGRIAVQLAPGESDAHALLACALGTRGYDEPAMGHFTEALRLQPRNAEARINMAWLLNRNGHFEEALRACQHALELNPESAAAWNELSVSLRRLCQVDRSVEAATRAAKLNPNHVGARINLGAALLEQGDWAHATASFREAIKIQPDASASFRSSMLLSLHYDPGRSRQDLFREHKEYQRVVAARGLSPARSHVNDSDPNRPIRIAYVSPFFRRHAVACFVEPILRWHDHSRFHVSCYSDVRVKDDLTGALRGMVQEWHDTANMNDAELARQILENREDILIDLTGHIDGSRLLAFASKPAPVQVTYLGYQNTTGLEAMDYRITDATADPPKTSDPFYVERLLRLPCFFCYQPPCDAPEVSPEHFESTRSITFGSLNHVAKLNPFVLELWSRILKEVPNSRLMLLVASTGVTDRRVADFLKGFGIERDRIEFVTRRPHAEYLALYNQIDIALDPHPFSGHTTTCDALWMGVPVITLAGETFASRMSTSVLTNLGLPQCVANDRRQYVGIAATLAGDRAALTQLRSSLRGRMSQSMVTDGKRFTAELENLYRRVWLTWCQSRSSGP